MLNPEGVNCLRFFDGRGNRVWGARTRQSDPEWKYVNVRRYFIYLEHSIDRATQWAVFEPNGERALGQHPRDDRGLPVQRVAQRRAAGQQARGGLSSCAATARTMTQNDLDNGRLICLIGVAPLKPAEFVIFRIGQKTADARS